MRIIKQSTLAAFWKKHPETEQPLKAWYQMAIRAQWTGMDDIRQAFPKAKLLNAERVRFEILGGNYRLIVAVFFPARIVWIKFLGTHAEYDRVDALTVDDF